MAGNNRTIGRQTDLQSGGKSPESVATVEGKTLKASDFVTRVRHRKDLKSDGESSTASANGGTKDRKIVRFLIKKASAVNKRIGSQKVLQSGNENLKTAATTENKAKQLPISTGFK